MPVGLGPMRVTRALFAKFRLAYLLSSNSMDGKSFGNNALMVILDRALTFSGVSIADALVALQRTTQREDLPGSDLELPLRAGNADTCTHVARAIL